MDPKRTFGSQGCLQSENDLVSVQEHDIGPVKIYGTMFRAYGSVARDSQACNFRYWQRPWGRFPC